MHAVFLQAFRDGNAAEMDTERVEAVLAAYVQDRDGSFVRLATEDGEADCYGLGEGPLMVNHASGERIWDVLVEAARAANLAVMPVDAPGCVTDEAMVGHLPEELRDDVPSRLLRRRPRRGHHRRCCGVSNVMSGSAGPRSHSTPPWTRSPFGGEGLTQPGGNST